MRLLLYRGNAEVGKTHSVMPHRKWRKKPLGGFLCEKICPAAFLAGIFIPDILQKIHVGRVAAAYRMCYDEVQNFKRSDGF